MSNESIIIKNIKNKCDTNAQDYFLNICDEIAKNIIPSKKLEKIETENINVPKFHESGMLLKYNYNVQQLKLIAKNYKLKISGNKLQLVGRIYSFLFLSNLIIKMQKIIRGYLRRKYNFYHGPAFKNRSLCVNNFDFLSMEEIQDIPLEQFFSFKDNDGFIYGFDILSLHNLIYKCNGAVKNPFNTKPLTSKVIEDFRTLIRISRVLNIPISIELADVTKEVSNKKSVELRALSLFQNIDSLGNYSNAQWFLVLTRVQLIKFMRELIDIWNYRAPLTIETKCAICPPNGNPFNRLPTLNLLINMENLDELRRIILEVLEKMITTGIDRDNKCLGAYYVLGAITLVNSEAAIALPWLYEAVCYGM